MSNTGKVAGWINGGDVKSLAYIVPIPGSGIAPVPFILAAAGAFTVQGITYNYDGNSDVTGATANNSAANRGMAVYEPTPRYAGITSWFAPFDRPDVTALSSAVFVGIGGGSIGAGGSSVDATDNKWYRGVDYIRESTAEAFHKVCNFVPPAQGIIRIVTAGRTVWWWST